VKLNASMSAAEVRPFETDIRRFTISPWQNRHAHWFPHVRGLVWLEACHTSSAAQKWMEFFGSHFQRMNEQAPRYWNRGKAHNSEKTLEDEGCENTGLDDMTQTCPLAHKIQSANRWAHTAAGEVFSVPE
jgi:hypothetical protein